VHLETHLGRQDDVLPAAVLLQRSSDDLLRATKPVDVGGVPERDSELDSLLEERLGILVSQGPFAESARGVAEAHATERNPADPKA
jgi:hypothetical protein